MRLPSAVVIRAMTRIVHRPIVVHLGEGGVPAAFRDGMDRHAICEIVDHWLEAGEWWNGESQRHVYRVMTEDEGLFDIERIEEQWWIYKIWD